MSDPKLVQSEPSIASAATIAKRAKKCLERLMTIAQPLADAASDEQLAVRAIKAASAAIFACDRGHPVHEEKVEAAVASAIARLNDPSRHRGKLSTLASETVDLIDQLRAMCADLADSDEARRRGQAAMRANFLLAKEYFESCEQETFRSPVEQAIHFLRAFAACQFRIGSLADVEEFIATQTIEQSVRRDASPANKSRLAQVHGTDAKSIARIAGRKRKVAA